MKLYKNEQRDLQFDTEGWIKFSDFLKFAIDYINEHHVDETIYEFDECEDLCPENATDLKNSTIELGTYVVADHNQFVNHKTAIIAISQLPSAHCERKREFSILGVDFSEVAYICSIPNVFNLRFYDEKRD